MRRIAVTLAIALAFWPATAAAQTPVENAPTPAIAAALADPRRPAEDRERDASRWAATLLELSGVGEGDRVADLVVGGGYFTRIFAALVGPEGHVYAWQPAEFIAFQSHYGEQLNAVDAAYENVTGLDDAFAELALPAESLDVVFTSQNYHDFHLAPFADDTAQRVNAAVFAALKPCGLYVVNDHRSVDGAGFSQVDSLHRVDRNAVALEIFEAGFTLTGLGNVPPNPDDPLTANVFDPSIRGRTAQFVFVFRKPGEDCGAGEQS